MPEALINGAKLWYDVSGRVNRSSFIMAIQPQGELGPVAETLKQHYQVIMMECRGTAQVNIRPRLYAQAICADVMA